MMHTQVQETKLNSALKLLTLQGHQQLIKHDHELMTLLEREYRRQNNQLMMIASASIATPGVLTCEGMPTTNVTTEGFPGNRYHAGCEWVDQIEKLAVQRARDLFNARFADLQAHSGSSANQILMFRFLKPGDVVLGMGLRSGGHLTHGASPSVTGQYFNSVSYGVREDGFLDYNQVRDQAKKHKPKLIICGASAYPRQIDFARFRDIADEVGALLLADISHISALVAVGLHPNPVDRAHFTTTSTYKQLLGPRGGLILMGEDYDLPYGKKNQPLYKIVQHGIFPYFQGTPNLSSVAAKAHALQLAFSDEFRRYVLRVLSCARELAAQMTHLGYPIVTGGTENHIVLVDLRGTGKTGYQVEKALEICGIITNKNQIPGDKSKSHICSGLRLGTNSLAWRGMDASQMSDCAQLIHVVIDGCSTHGEKSVTVPGRLRDKVRERVESLCRKFTIPNYPLHGEIL